MTLSALHLGIDKYPGGHALQKCVSDARGLKGVFGGELLLNQQCTRSEILRAIRETALRPGKGQWGVVSYSGHGTPVNDRSGDEGDGWDEAIVDVGLNPVLDDDLAPTLAGRNTKSRLLLIFDSCFSGTMQRAMPVLGRRHQTAARRQHMRYLAPGFVKADRRPIGNKAEQKPLANVVVISGCTDFEFSYEGLKHGVLTGALLATYKPGLTIQAWFNATCEVVAQSGYPQHPQLSASTTARKWLVPEP